MSFFEYVKIMTYFEYVKIMTSDQLYHSKETPIPFEWREYSRLIY